MIVNPRPGRLVRIWYRGDVAPSRPLHGRVGTVVVASRGKPRNHGVLVDGVLVVVPCGNLIDVDGVTSRKWREMSYKNRVAKGMDLLDRVTPGWESRVEFKTLAMETCSYCVLGQVYGSYRAGFKALLAPLPSDRLFQASAFGFTLTEDDQMGPDDEVMRRWTALANAWRVAIRGRNRGH